MTVERVFTQMCDMECSIEVEVDDVVADLSAHVM